MKCPKCKTEITIDDYEAWLPSEEEIKGIVEYGLEQFEYSENKLLSLEIEDITKAISKRLGR